MVKEWLSQYPALKAGLYRIAREMDRREDSPRLDEEAERITTELTAIENALDAVSDPLHREVLWVRYLHGPIGRLNPWREVSKEIYGNDTSADLLRLHRLHREAIKGVTMPNR